MIFFSFFNAFHNYSTFYLQLYWLKTVIKMSKTKHKKKLYFEQLFIIYTYNDKRLESKTEKQKLKKQQQRCRKNWQIFLNILDKFQLNFEAPLIINKSKFTITRLSTNNAYLLINLIQAKVIKIAKACNLLEFYWQFLKFKTVLIKKNILNLVEAIKSSAKS